LILGSVMNDYSDNDFQCQHSLCKMILYKNLQRGGLFSFWKTFLQLFDRYWSVFSQFR